MRLQKFLFLAFLAASTAPALPAQTPAPADPFPIPSTFTATLPCADCPAIHESLTLLPGGIALDRLIYEERNVSSQSLAHWALSSNASRLSIRSSGAAGPYSILDATHIKKLAPPGNSIPDAYLPAFTRADKVAIPSEPLSIRGDYFPRESNSSIVECDSRVEIAVSPGGDALALNDAYRAANLKIGTPLLVNVTGRLVLRESVGGSNGVVILEIDHFDHAWPGKTCCPPNTICQS